MTTKLFVPHDLIDTANVVLKSRFSNAIPKYLLTKDIDFRNKFYKGKITKKFKVYLHFMEDYNHPKNSHKWKTQGICIYPDDSRKNLNKKRKDYLLSQIKET